MSECEVVVLTGEATIEAAVEAMKLGAREFLKSQLASRNFIDSFARLTKQASSAKKTASSRPRSPTTIVARHHRRVTVDAGSLSAGRPRRPDR